MNVFKKHSDNLLLIGIIFVFIVGTFIFVQRLKSTRDGWQTNFDQSSIDPDDVTYGGLGRDGRIRPIDRPLFDTVMMAASKISADTPVIVVVYNNDVRAYPLNIMAAHEVVNDTIGNNLPIAVTFCPLCNSAIVYERRIDGQTLRLGISGNLYGNNFLMYDDITESWWYQFTGEALIGDYTGEMLDVVASQIVGFSAYAMRYPDGMVLVGDAERPDLNYDVSPYPGYDENASPLVNSQDFDPRLDPMDRVLASTVNETHIAYSFDVLSQVGVVNDMVNSDPVVAFWQPGVSSALSVGSANAMDVGQAALFGREVDDMVLTFYYENGRIFDNETSSEWNIFGEAIAGDLIGEALYDYECFSHYWFAWSSTYPETLLYHNQ